MSACYIFHTENVFSALRHCCDSDELDLVWHSNENEYQELRQCENHGEDNNGSDEFCSALYTDQCTTHN